MCKTRTAAKTLAGAASGGGAEPSPKMRCTGTNRMKHTVSTTASSAAWHQERQYQLQEPAWHELRLFWATHCLLAAKGTAWMWRLKPIQLL